MNAIKLTKANLFAHCQMILILCLAGCAGTHDTADISGPQPTGKSFPVWYHTPDKRTITIGKSVPSNNGWSFSDPHMLKCWLSDSFRFTGYDTVLILPTQSAVTVDPQAEGTFDIAKTNLVADMQEQFRSSNLFANVVTSETDIKPGARVLRAENTITKFKKGGKGARFWAGELGAGQPIIRVATRMSDGNTVLFSCEAERSGVSAGSRELGAWRTDEDIQRKDIHSLVLDMTDFMAAIAGKYHAEK